MQTQQTIWSEYPYPDAVSDRGWLKAITEPWSIEDRLTYTSETMPVYDEEIKAWREQSTLGNYLDYGRIEYSEEYKAKRFPDGAVHAVCYASKQAKYFRTVEEARQWIEAESKRVRPELQTQEVAR